MAGGACLRSARPDSRRVCRQHVACQTRPTRAQHQCVDACEAVHVRARPIDRRFASLAHHRHCFRVVTLGDLSNSLTPRATTTPRPHRRSPHTYTHSHTHISRLPTIPPHHVLHFVCLSFYTSPVVSAVRLGPWPLSRSVSTSSAGIDRLSSSNLFLARAQVSLYMSSLVYFARK